MPSTPSPLPTHPDVQTPRTVRLPGGEMATSELTTALEWAWRVAAPAGVGEADLGARRARIEAFMPVLGSALEAHEGWDPRDWAASLESPHRPGATISVTEVGTALPFPSPNPDVQGLLDPIQRFPVPMTEANAVDLLRGLQLRARQQGMAPPEGRTTPSTPLWYAVTEVGSRVALEAERAFGWAPGVWAALGTDPVRARLVVPKVSRPTVR